MPSLLVSVRSGPEAAAALAGGAAIIDVKEPLLGPLGRASADAWREVRALVPHDVPVSVALGELADSSDANVKAIPRDAWTGISYCKIGLSNAPAGWLNRWRNLRELVIESALETPLWVAVVYMDWQAAHAPDPQSIIDAASAIEQCRGVLFDTWDKSSGCRIDHGWMASIDRVRRSGRLVALAGSLDAERIEQLAPLEPDFFAVRGAACVGGDRLGSIDREKVSILARAAASRGLQPAGRYLV